MAVHQGTNTLRFDGLISRTHRLPPGVYTATIRAVNPSGQTSRPLALRFTIAA
jgi:predicted phage tail protein